MSLSAPTKAKSRVAQGLTAGDMFLGGKLTHTGVLQHPGNDYLDQEADDAHCQANVQNDGAEFAGIAALGQVPDDKNHERDQGTHAQGHAIVTQPLIHCRYPPIISPPGIARPFTRPC
jgi:hypothetical protein